MLRRTFLVTTGLPWALALAGCRGQRQFARIVNPGDKALMGSHQAGAETFGPLVDEAVAKLLARHAEMPVLQVGRVAFGVPGASYRVSAFVSNRADVGGPSNFSLQLVHGATIASSASVTPTETWTEVSSCVTLDPQIPAGPLRVRFNTVSAVAALTRVLIDDVTFTPVQSCPQP